MHGTQAETQPGQPDNQEDRFLDSNRFDSDEEFDALVRTVEKAIQQGIFPVRICEGSSGAYMALDSACEVKGVFKPKNEEPYGALNPKWTKWAQRNVLPCCFGRGCLSLNQGYLAEVAASVVDKWLGLDIVPKTRVIRLAAPTFNYSKMELAKVEAKLKITQSCPRIGRYFNRLGLPFKLGSLQTFMNGYISGTRWLSLFDRQKAPDVIEELFAKQFERLVVLDYIIRNTDRSNSNWLVRCAGLEVNKSPGRRASLVWDNKVLSSCPEVKIAAIDNGLSFPFKHPDEWRNYPYRWIFSRFARAPFSQEIKELVLPKISDPKQLFGLAEELRELYRIDIAFNDMTFESQMGVLRGQCRNLQTALEAPNMNPLKLVEMKPLKLVWKKSPAPSYYEPSDDVSWSSYSVVDNLKRPVCKWW